MKCLILAAGYATRLYPLTRNFPKPLLDVNGKTIVDWLIDDIDSTDKVDQYIVVSNDKFYNHFVEWRENNSLKDKITIINDGTTNNENRLGAIRDIELGIKSLSIDDDLIVIAGDNVLDFSLGEFINYFESKNSTSIMRYYEKDINKIKKSAEVVFDDNDKVLEMNEKPNNPKSNWCCPPFYIYSSDDVRKVSLALNDNCNYDAPGSFINWLYKKSDVYSMEMPGNRYDIGNLESYHDVFLVFLILLNLYFHYNFYCCF